MKLGENGFVLGASRSESLKMAYDIKEGNVMGVWQCRANVYCHECSKAGGADMPIYHQPPVCNPTPLTKKVETIPADKWDIPRLEQGAALNFGHLRKINEARCNTCYHHLDTWSCTDWATALGGEVGELLNKIKKLRRLQDGTDKPYNKGVDPTQLRLEIMREAADVVIYLDLLMASLKISLGYAVMLKFNETTKKYNFPNQFLLDPTAK